MYTVSRSSAGVCVIINSKCCGPQIKASGFSTKQPALISPKQVSVRYRLSFTLLSSSPPLSSVPPTLPASSADIGSSPANPLVTEKRWGERKRAREVEGSEAGRQKRGGEGEEEREGRCKEAKTKLKTQSHVSLLKPLPLEHSDLNKQLCVFALMLLYTLSFLSIHLYQGPLIFISLPVLWCISFSLFSPPLSISLSLCLTALTAIEAC